jgi:two-component sensor histidine kinase
MAAAARVVTVARMHRAFSTDESPDYVPIVGYLRQLCGDLSGVLAADIGVEGLEENVPKGQILAIGLIVNELVTNARKHGAGRIKVAFGAEPSGQHELRVLDEGHAPSDDLAADRPGADGLGLQVVNALVTQLDGRISVHPNPSGRSRCVAVTFPAS